MRKLIGLFALLCFVGLQICFSQTREVTGTVIDKQDKSPLPGVSVVVKGNPATGVATDANGKFALKVNDGDVLVFSFIGMKPQEIAVNGKTSIQVEMESASETLDEVMVVAYGT
ncbi:MAG: carboxypeptidase-like regulatory domain-containing protein, partial [Odoribacter sp.]|nr:carboxypeptidase-like regulatory domain-containing protein [Odoribacter sp.]